MYTIPTRMSKFPRDAVQKPAENPARQGYAGCPQPAQPRRDVPTLLQIGEDHVGVYAAITVRVVTTSSQSSSEDEAVAVTLNVAPEAAAGPSMTLKPCPPPRAFQLSLTL